MNVVLCSSNPSQSVYLTTQQLKQLQLQLSRIILQEPPEWQFNSLRTDADRMLSQTDSIRLRSQLEAFLHRIELFEQVRSKRIAWNEKQPLGNAQELKRLDSIGEDPFAAEWMADSKLQASLESPKQRAQTDLRPRPLRSGKSPESRNGGAGK